MGTLYCTAYPYPTRVNLGHGSSIDFRRLSRPICLELTVFTKAIMYELRATATYKIRAHYDQSDLSTAHAASHAALLGIPHKFYAGSTMA